MDTSLGGVCWHCHWGWSKQVRAIYDRAVAAIDALGDERDGFTAMRFGPAHIVWDDENWDCAEGCIAECDLPQFSDWSPAVLEIVRESLRALVALPDHVRDPCPDDYAGEDPERYPPVAGVEMAGK